MQEVASRDYGEFLSDLKKVDVISLVCIAPLVLAQIPLCYHFIALELV